MKNPEAGQVADLHPAPLAIGQDDLRAHAVDRLSEIPSNLLGNVVLLFFKAEHSAQTATIGLDVFNRQAWNEA